MDLASFVWGILAGLGIACVAVWAAVLWQNRQIRSLRKEADEARGKLEKELARLAATRARGPVFVDTTIFRA